MTLASSSVPDTRVRAANGGVVRGDGEFVLYWMTAFRRPTHNFALQRAADWSRELNLPLVVLEALSVDYRWASDRIHAFVIDGMAANAADLRRSGAAVHTYVEPEPGAGDGLLQALADRAAVVVGDDAPVHDLRTMIDAVAPRLPVLFETVDSNGLIPLRATEKVFARAYDFRRFMQKDILDHLAEAPESDPLVGIPPAGDDLLAEIVRRWPSSDEPSRTMVDHLPIDHGVPPVGLVGGTRAAHDRLRDFVEHRLSRYLDRNHPDRDVVSGLSPYLHFGHISSHQVFDSVADWASWAPHAVADRAKGQREGWWGAGEQAEAFLDQLVTWRELGFNTAWHKPASDTYESLPAWARATLEEHAADPRPSLYHLDQFLYADTHDHIWNAAQRQLLEDGVIHNYLRMLWGKKILEWTETPRVALNVMIELNNRLAIDGRDPNSTSGIFWVLGRYDRPWPERAVYGKVRTMTSDSTRRKLRLKNYLERYGPGSDQLAFE